MSEFLVGLRGFLWVWVRFVVLWVGYIYMGFSDFYISSNSNTNNQSLSKLGFTFKHPDYNDDSKEAESLLAGSYNFSTSEIEVYQVIQ